LPIFAPGEKVSIDQLTQLSINAQKAEGKLLRWIKELAVLVKTHFIPVFSQRPVEEIRFEKSVEIIGKGSITGKRFRVQEHDDLTVSHVLIREIESIDSDRLQAKTVAKGFTALTKYAGTEKTMTVAAKTVFERCASDGKRLEKAP